LHAVPSAVKQAALENGLAVSQPQTLKAIEVQHELAAIGADAMVVAAYGLILPQAVLDLPRLGCLNIHASLLPRWRGAAPIQRAILAGDRETGISIMRMDAGLDTGAVLLEEKIPIAADDTAQTLHDKLAVLGATCVVRALDALSRGTLQPQPQSAEGVTYAAKIGKAEAQLDWRRAAPELERAVRAYNPFPVAQASMDGEPLKIWQARATEAAGQPGQVLHVGADGIVVACGSGALRIEQLQKAGGKKLGAGEFLRGYAIQPGACFALPA
jgi:methionyl-tRNA formyltransferase